MDKIRFQSNTSPQPNTVKGQKTKDSKPFATPVRRKTSTVQGCRFIPSRGRKSSIVQDGFLQRRNVRDKKQKGSKRFANPDGASHNCHTKGCKQGSEENMSNPMIDLTGKQFGKLTVITRAENTRAGLTQWLCQCECGTIKTIRGTHLRSGRIISCGCVRRGPCPTRFPDLTGQKFGRLTVISRVSSNQTGHSRWLCQCDCGNKKIVLAQCLVQKCTKSCGCLRDGVKLPNETTRR